MYKNVTTLLITLLLSTVCFAKVDIRERLAQSLVEIEDGKYIFTSYKLVSGADKLRTSQVSVFCEAPVELISRDMFVKISVLYESIMMDGMEKDGKNKKVKSENVQALIGEPDYEFSIIMSEIGMQISIKDHKQNKSERITRTWDDALSGR